MRKPRAIIFDDDVFVLELLESFLTKRGYEVMTFSEPVVCPVYGRNGNKCSNIKSCSDIIITDYKMPGKNGIELLESQIQRGCKADMKNKALISGYVDAETIQEKVRQLGCAFFGKPFRLSGIAEWLNECEGRMDLSLPVGIVRRETRHPVSMQITYSLHYQDEPLSGIMTDFSDSGLCLQTCNSLEKDQPIRIRTELPNSLQTATVRWIRKRDDNSYMAGCSCHG
ncbi:MAG: response regulator [Nitrospirae bacterium]|nr:response regulator [Nitrospirota bacterium]